ncbi:Tm-1-like ATP-binding domain-containing protein [Hydrogenophaga sp.]|uniref:ATP-binding cassette domain-containing protein n=1 Tax=Hydrogenophaga sp. TaxID=1904254 RepID=UPI00272F5624|nr:Tm-1-like ATP-binding domain-containing protein [Hydrogenophaga sp.]MDP2017332.1 Tm-1-like ATP-binding domain-containing protein [Hydrogenophaga sp.]MDP3168582.1 Tm-1-like ATP-binding domain-containing protein [Hydrogenophaga sp.]
MRTTESETRGGTSGRGPSTPALKIDNLDVYYGQAHALQGVSLELDEGVLAVVGRNGMGKTTLCKAITGMVPASGSIQFAGQELLGSSPDTITRLGVAYVPQGRRVWRSLTVDETLRLASKTARQGAWTVERVYQVFPRLAERRANGGAQLSGGEQQMLAIGRALLFNPRVLVMDEPTEGLAPVIVEQVATLLKALADERSMSVLLIEQNLGVALEVADQVAIMVNGRIAHCLPASELAADRALQQRLLGLKAGASTEDPAGMDPSVGAGAHDARVLRVIRSHAPDQERFVEQAHDQAMPAVTMGDDTPATSRPRPQPAAEPKTTDASIQQRAVYLAGAWAEQQKELTYVKQCMEQLGARVISVDIGGQGFSSAQVGVQELVRHQPTVQSQASSTHPLLEAFPSYLLSRRDLGALLVLTQAGTSAVACAGAQALPVGIPKMIITDRALPGSDADVMVMTAPIGQFNRVSETLLAHAAAATVGMLGESAALHRGSKPLVCIASMDLAGAATRHAIRALGQGIDGLVLDMTSGGASTLMRLAKSGLVAGIIDLAPVDVSKAHLSGDHAQAHARFSALQASGVPYLLVPTLFEVAAYPVGQAVPARVIQRDIVSSAHDGSLVPLTVTEVGALTEWVATRLADFVGPVHVAMPKTTATALQRLGGGNESIAIQEAIHKGLLRRLKPRQLLQISEHTDTLHDLRFGEFLGKTMQAFIQNRVGV